MEMRLLQLRKHLLEDERCRIARVGFEDSFPIPVPQWEPDRIDQSRIPMRVPNGLPDLIEGSQMLVPIKKQFVSRSPARCLGSRWRGFLSQGNRSRRQDRDQDAQSLSKPKTCVENPTHRRSCWFFAGCFFAMSQSHNPRNLAR